jgi:hypothetical protein
MPLSYGLWSPEIDLSDPGYNIKWDIKWEVSVGSILTSQT